jgi:ABC-type multidrug transport system permease subunit
MMPDSVIIAIIGNFLLIGGLLFYGFTFFAKYHATGKWAKNITSLLAGLGMLMLAFALVITPRNAGVIARIAETKASNVFLGMSSGLLLAAIAAFGVITYWRPLRLRHERKIERDLSSELPKIQ